MSLKKTYFTLIRKEKSSLPKKKIKDKKITSYNTEYAVSLPLVTTPIFAGDDSLRSLLYHQQTSHILERYMKAVCTISWEGGHPCPLKVE